METSNSQRAHRQRHVTTAQYMSRINSSQCCCRSPGTLRERVDARLVSIPQKGMEKAAGAGIDRTREIGSKRWRSSDTRHSGGILFRSAFVIYRSFIVPKHRCRNLMGNRSVKENYPYIQHQGKGKERLLMHAKNDNACHLIILKNDNARHFELPVPIVKLY